MGLENCQIKFNNENAIFYPGQVVSGNVEFNFNSMKKIKGISVVFKGEAHVHWTESETRRDSNNKSVTHSVPYNANEEYFSTKYYLLGGGHNDNIQIPAGKYVYPFTTTLPNVLPSSFEGEKGYIRYTVKVTLERPWKFDQTIKAAFTVLTHVDCNNNEQAKKPATLTMEKFLCCLCCREGPITGVLKLPYTGFVSGQMIPYTVEIDNASKTCIAGITMKLKKIVTFHSHTPRSKTKKDEVTVKEFLIGQTVNGRDSKTFSNSFILPSLPPSNLDNCRIIDLEYVLKVQVEIDGFHKNMTGKVPILVGTIPLANAMPSISSAQNTYVPNEETSVSQPLVGWVADHSVPTVPVDPSYMLPPPSYEECQFGTASILDKSDSEYTRFNKGQSYAPCYPVYNFTAMPMPQVPPVQGTSFMPGSVPAPAYGLSSSNVPSAPPS